MIIFPSVTSISGWAKSTVQYLGGDPKTPYVLKDGLYNYFSFNGENYVLFCTSIKDLNQKEK